MVQGIELPKRIVNQGTMGIYFGEGIPNNFDDFATVGSIYMNTEPTKNQRMFIKSEKGWMPVETV